MNLSPNDLRPAPRLPDPPLRTAAASGGGPLESSHDLEACCYGCKPASECPCFLQHIEDEAACLCHGSEPDSFGMREHIVNPDCPLCGEGR